MAGEIGWCDGKFLQADSIMVPASSSTLHYGTGIFDSLLSIDGKIFMLDGHLDRLYRSMAESGLNPKVPKDRLRTALEELVRKNRDKPCYIRLLALKGTDFTDIGKRGADASIYALPILMNKHVYKLGMLRPETLRTALTPNSPPQGLATIKFTGRYLYPHMMLGGDNGSTDILFHDDSGHIIETTKANIFFAKGKTLSTPPKGSIIPGITREVVIGIARDLGYAVKEEHMSIKSLGKSDECFMTGTYVGIKSVSRVDKTVFRQTKAASEIRKEYLKLL